MSSSQKRPATCTLLDLQAFSYGERRKILSGLDLALDVTSCWIIERRHFSVLQTFFRFEVELRSIVDLYSALIGTGLELTRGSHIGLTGLCTLQNHQQQRDAFHIVEVHMELHFLEEASLVAALFRRAASA